MGRNETLAGMGKLVYIWVTALGLYPLRWNVAGYCTAEPLSGQCLWSHMRKNTENLPWSCISLISYFYAYVNCFFTDLCNYWSWIWVGVRWQEWSRCRLSVIFKIRRLLLLLIRVCGERWGCEHSPWSGCLFTSSSIHLLAICASCEFQVGNLLNFIIMATMATMAYQLKELKEAARTAKLVQRKSFIKAAVAVHKAAGAKSMVRLHFFLGFCRKVFFGCVCRLCL